ncbi:MAG: hypothetical protein WBM54_03080, partial [Woeseia sp.]
TSTLRRRASVGKAAERLLERATDRHGLSARCYQRMLRVALTIADLAGVDAIEEVHMAEALSLRGVTERRAVA